MCMEIRDLQIDEYADVTSAFKRLRINYPLYATQIRKYVEGKKYLKEIKIPLHKFSKQTQHVVLDAVEAFSLYVVCERIVNIVGLECSMSRKVDLHILRAAVVASLLLFFNRKFFPVAITEDMLISGKTGSMIRASTRDYFIKTPYMKVMISSACNAILSAYSKERKKRGHRGDIIVSFERISKDEKETRSIFHSLEEKILGLVLEKEEPELADIIDSSGA